MLNLRRLIQQKTGREVDLVQERVDYRRIPQSVLMNLVELCGPMEPPPSEGDLYRLGKRDGRREVWLHIQQRLCLTEAEVYALMMGKPIAKAEEWYRAGMV